MNALVSIIVPVYNAEKWIGRCIHSIKRQTYSQWELICINDGSSDKSGKIIDAEASGDFRVRIISQKQGGVSAARNAGLKVARGKYILFVDADDVVEREMVQKMVAAMEKDEVDLVTCGYWDCDESAKKRDYRPPYRSSFVLEGAQKLSPMGVAMSLPFVWGKLYRRDIIQKNGLEFDYCIHFSEDSLFVFRYLQCSGRVSYFHDGLYLYCHREGSALSEIACGNRPLREYVNIMQESLNSFKMKEGIERDSVLSLRQWRTLAFIRVCVAAKVIWTTVTHQGGFIGRLQIGLTMCVVLLHGLCKARVWLSWRLFYNVLRYAVSK